MTDVQAPYRFVPLSKWVYMPDWAHLISHDVPLKDGYSGALNYRLTNHSDLCVGGSVDQAGILRFARDGSNNLTIPGSSLKGMIRNVLEIASFGKFNAVDDQRFSYRDFSSSKNHYLSNVIGANNVIAGWLKFNPTTSQWQLRKCQFAKVSHKEIKQQLGVQIKNTTPAQQKYQQLPLATSYSSIISGPKGKQKNRWAEQLSTGQATGKAEGHFVFTHNRIKGKGDAQDYEFSYFFYQPEAAPSYHDLEQQVQSLFTNHLNEHVKYLQDHAHQELGIPVFALIKKDAPSQVHSLGLAKTPRVSYQHSIHDLINQLNPAHLDEAYFDMAELMFGTLRDNGLGLKSRVVFSDASPLQAQPWDSILKLAAPTVLSSPKATFLGAYLEQKDAQKYTTYDQKEALLAGWKRYPTRKEYTTHEPSNDNQSVQNRFELLPEGYEFDGKIVFHNLKAEELAALIWCLTLAGSDDHHHSLGHAKPLGAGAVQIKIDPQTSIIKTNNGSQLETIEIAKWVNRFAEHMNQRFEPNGKWEQTPQLKYLLALTDKDIENANEFAYLNLTDYQSIKNKTASMPDLEYNGQTLSREDIASSDVDKDEKKTHSVSPAFAQGRLSALFDSDNHFHQQQIEGKAHYQRGIEQRREKAKLTEEKQAITNADLPPYEKLLQHTEWLIKSQNGFNATEKKDQTKQFREQIKALKTLPLTTEQAQTLLARVNKIEFCSKEAKKAAAFLEKVQ